MSFGTYARRVRDRDLPFGARYRAFVHALGQYCPIGFQATWSYLSTMGDVMADEETLVRALDILEASRSVWLAEMEAFTARRRAEKRQHRRSPSAADRLYLYGCRWPGPDAHKVMCYEIGRLWAEHLREPFPETPAETKCDLVHLDSTIAGCVSIYLSHGGETGPEHRAILLTCLAGLRSHLPQPGYPSVLPYVRRLRKLSELIINDV